MPRHVMMWWLAGGATVLGASLAYMATRPVIGPAVARAQDGWSRMRSRGSGGARRTDAEARTRESARPIRNVAFEAYRSSELKRLEDEERDFHAYLERLRGARDKTEFETYQRERMSTSTSAEGAPQP
jgi:hypothetical protein